MRRILAALIFFTRLPFWRIAEVPKEYYERVVPLWPLAGWLTGGIMAGVFYLSTMLFDINVSIVLAIISRILVTGALHEDGFADFCDGFGGGSTGSPTETRERILEIMKDSHIGTYGVLGLILYYLIIYNILVALFATGITPLIFIVADAASKMVSSTIVWFLPYARKESEAKNKLIYSDTPTTDKLLSFCLGMLPVIIVCLLDINLLTPCFVAIFVTIIVAAFLFYKMHRSINGYTGDCCGATFIILELSFYLTLLVTIISLPWGGLG